MPMIARTVLLLGLALAGAACAGPRPVEPAARASQAAELTIATFAGDAEAFTGHRDGVGLQARFTYPLGLATGPDGAVYVADYGNHCIRRIAPDGTVTTLAGDLAAPRAGHRDGAGAGAIFNGPTSVAVGADGTVYVADTLNHCIRRIRPDGTVTTLAGDIRAPAARARFRGPNGVVVGPDGRVYVADAGNHALRVITPDGQVSTLAGSATRPLPGHRDGPGAQARFDSPNGLAFDAGGRLVVSDSSNHLIRRVAPDGTVTTLAGDVNAPGAGHVDGRGAAARFYYPSGVAVAPDGHVYVSDYGNHRIRRVSPEGVVTTLGGPFSGHAASAGVANRLRFPHGVAARPSVGLYVADYGNNCIRLIRW